MNPSQVPFVYVFLCFLITITAGRNDDQTETTFRRGRIMSPNVMIIAMLILLLPYSSFAEPRAQIIKLKCGTQIEQNATINMANFISTMDKITLQMQTSGFGAAATGSGRHASYGLAQCYDDLSPTDCTLCYVEARNILPQCYPSNGARVYLDGCFLRAQNYSFYHEYSGPDDSTVCGNRTRDLSKFEESVRKALWQAVSTASRNEGYARAEVAVVGAENESVYLLADCWRTISASACRACLESASASVLECLPASEGRALNTGCFVRYSDSDFMNPVPQKESSTGSVIVILIAASGAAVSIVGAVIGVYVWKKIILQKNRKDDEEKLVGTLNHSSLNFKYSTLERATGSFDEAKKLGQGGFGTVYKGVLQDGREIAVKRLFSNNKHRAIDFYNEINIISSVEHKNLVRLLGCSCLGPESLLVYEFCSNKSLDGFIFDSSKGKELTWEKRFKIIVGTAEGLVCLHENTRTRIIHRDIKASNILLDSRMRAKIADFGLARCFREDQSHISTAIAGTLGYMAPEYLAYGQLTEKADVYSFGVLLLEIVTGRRNNEGESSDYIESLLSRAWKHFKQGTFHELVDPNLMLGDWNEINDNITEMLRVVQVGLLCTQEIPSSRPTMSKTLLMLEAKEHPPEPSNPPFMDEETMEFNCTRRSALLILDKGNDASIATISQSILLPR